MTLSDLLSSDVTDVLLNTSDFASSVTQWPGGRQEQSATVTAVVIPMEVMRETDRGEEFRQIQEIQVATSVTVAERDIWIINNERWSVDRIGNPDFGVQPIHLVRVEPNLTTKSGGGVL